MRARPITGLLQEVSQTGKRGGAPWVDLDQLFERVPLGHNVALLASKPGTQIEDLSRRQSVRPEMFERLAGTLEVRSRYRPVQPPLPGRGVIGPRLEAGLQLDPGSIKLARAGRQMSPGKRQGGEIVLAVRAGGPLEQAQIPLQWKSFEVQAHPLVQQDEPRGDVAAREEGCVLPLALDHRTRLVQPSLLTQDDEQQTPQGRKLGTGPFHGRPEYAFGVGNSTKRNGRLRACQRRWTGPGGSGWHACPEIEGKIGLAPGRFATTELEEHFRVAGALAGKSKQPLTSQRDETGFEFDAGLR